MVSTADLSFENSQFYSDCSSMLSTTNGWVSNAQYSTPPLPYTINTTSSPAYCTKPGMSTPRNQQNLPSLNDMNLPGSSPVYAGRTPQMPRQYAQPQYFNTTSTDPMDISYSKGPHVTYGTPYGIVTNARSSYTVPGCTEWSPVSDMYYTNGQSWPPSMPCSQPTYVGSDTSSLSGGRRRRGNLPKHVTDILRAWFQDHLDHPYPTEEDKQALMRQTNLSISQVSLTFNCERNILTEAQISNWFINARRRHWPQMKQNRENSRSVHSRSLCWCRLWSWSRIYVTLATEVIV